LPQWSEVLNEADATIGNQLYGHREEDERGYCDGTCEKNEKSSLFKNGLWFKFSREVEKGDEGEKEKD
jgi:hypothetical protein